MNSVVPLSIASIYTKEVTDKDTTLFIMSSLSYNQTSEVIIQILIGLDLALLISEV
jgi:hypothetical protein